MYSIFSVTSPASDTSLLTIAELRAAVGAVDGSQDAALLVLGRGVSATISRQCCLAADGVNPPTLLQETCTDVFRLRRKADGLLLSRRPVTEITSVEVDGDPLDADEYEVDPATGILRRLCDDTPIDWTCGKIEVEYVAGYSTAPDDLKEAAKKLATAFNAERTRDPSLKR
jgi:uncharacterized phiE125 gp8 family phage protein